MRTHTISTRYLKEMEKATVRQPDGSPAGEVTDEKSPALPSYFVSALKAGRAAQGGSSCQ